MVLVEGGTFKMGCPGDRTDCGRAWPQVEQTVSSFYISKYELTQREWEALMEYNPSGYPCPECPVERVSWFTVQAFIEKLNKLSGKKFRLPTEKEWEFASKGGAKSQVFKYAGSNNIDTVAWNKFNCSSIQPVGKKQPNELGLFDMSGNVFEWCDSYFTETLEIYKTSPEGPTNGSEKVTKGGSWRMPEFFSQPMRRNGVSPTLYSTDIGFRLALTQ